MTKKSTKVLKKTTDTGITVTIEGNNVIKKYSKSCICMVTFSTRKAAIKEFNLFRQSYKEV